MSDPIFPKAVWQEGTLQNDVPANDNSLRDEALGRPVEAIANSPSVTDDGTVYIVGAAPSGAFSAFDPDDLTIFRGGTWYAWAPTEGLEANGYQYTGSGGWVVGGGGGAVSSVNGQTGSVLLALDDLDDVNASAPSDGQVLTWDSGAGEWVAETPTGGGMTNPMTTAGDIIIGGASGTPARLAIGTNAYVLTVVAGAPAWAAAGGGSLTNWTEGVNTSAPNATVPVVSFLATNAATNVDAAIVAKGTGATLAQIPDNGTGGGNKRGAGATDFQKSRSLSTQVASGSESVICGGAQNSATALRAFVGAGTGNSASGSGSAIPGGLSNIASAQYSFAMGNSCTADGDRSRAFGQQSTARGAIGVEAMSSGQILVAGDCQNRRFHLQAFTTNATVTAATADGSAPGGSNQVTLPNNSAFIVMATVMARQATTGDSASWTVLAHIKRGANAAATSIVGTATVTAVGTDAGAAAWVLAAVADTTNGSLRFNVTGEAAKTIKWGVHVYSCNEIA